MEQVYHYCTSDEKAIERIVQDENIHLYHMVLPGGESFPEHFANATVYMTVIRGRLSIDLGLQETHEYSRGDILKIPQGTKMRGYNQQDDVLELLIVKSPAPQNG